MRFTYLCVAIGVLGPASAANVKRSKRDFLGGLLGARGSGNLPLVGGRPLGSLLGLGTNSGGLLGVGDDLAVLVKSLGSGTEGLTDNVDAGLKGVGLGNVGSGLGEIVKGAGSGFHDLTTETSSGLEGFGNFSGGDILGELLHELGDTVRGAGSGTQDLANGVGQGLKKGGVYLQTGLGSALDELLSDVGSAADQTTVILYKLLNAHILQLVDANASRK